MLGISVTAQYAVYMLGVGVLLWVLLAVVPWAVARKRAHRSWFQRTLLSFNVFLVTVAVTAAGGLTWFSDQIAEIPRVPLGDEVLSQEREPDDPQNFLLVGIDEAEGLDPDDPVNIGRNPTSTLSDTIMVLRVIPESEEAHLVSFPRDLWLPIAGTGGSGKINTALTVGGPETLIRTIEENYGIPIHHYVQVNFQGFKELVGILGGVPLYFPDPVRDPTSGLDIEVPEDGACVTLEPDQALAFVRSRRQYQELIDGTWQTDPTADLGRISRQQLFIRAALDRAIDRGVRHPPTLQQFIDLGEDHVVLDDTLTTRDLFDLGEQFSEFDADSLETYELPVRGGNAGAASVVFLVEQQAQDELNVFRGVSNAIPTFAGVRVDVRNGSGTSGQATQVSNDLTEIGFTVVSTADASSFDHPRTVIRHGPEDLVTAVFLGRYLDADVQFEEVPDLGGSTVELVTGRDYRGVRAEPRPDEWVEQVLATTTTTTTTTTTVAPGAEDATTTTTITGFVPEQPDGVTC